jgi:uncharacterized membrane protein
VAGSPAWRSLAVRAFHIRAVAVYFAALLAWRRRRGSRGGREPCGSSRIGAIGAPIAVAGLALLALFAWLVGRTTIYTITEPPRGHPVRDCAADHTQPALQG